MARNRKGLIELRLLGFAFDGVLSSETKLFVPPLHNFNEQGQMCFGNIRNLNKSDPGDFVEEAFFKTTFTHPYAEFPMIEIPLSQYLHGHRETGWDLADLPEWGTVQELMEVTF